jgi:hypothetical protein
MYFSQTYENRCLFHNAGCIGNIYYRLVSSIGHDRRTRWSLFPFKETGRSGYFHPFLYHSRNCQFQPLYAARLLLVRNMGLPDRSISSVSMKG